MQRSPIFGVVEGFYGVFYTHPQRVDLIRFIGAHGYNAYLYAPKNDRQQRLRWWEAYPPRIMRHFAESVAAGRDCGVDFTYGISPGGSICYSSEEDFARLTGKLRSFYEIGVRSFALLMDDTENSFRHPADQRTYATLALAQADLANRLHAWLDDQEQPCRLSFCPVDYSGAPPFTPAIHQLGAALHPEIDVFYTGPEICSPVITTDHIQSFASAIQRQPVLWDNYPVNDLSMQPELHLGPVEGRPVEIKQGVRGVLVAAMLQPEAGKIPLMTYASWWKQEPYQSSQAFAAALREIGGDDVIESLNIFCHHSISSFISPSADTGLDRTVQALLRDLSAGVAVDESGHAAALIAQLDSIDEACYQIKFRLENLALRQDLLPWIEVLEHWVWMSRRALTLLRALEKGQQDQKTMASMLEYQQLIQHHPRRVPAEGLIPLVEYALEQNHLVESQNNKSTTKRNRWPRITFPRFDWKKFGKPV